MNDKLKQLYHTVILEHDKSPVNFAERKNATHIVEAFNPICGDRFTIYFEIKNGYIEDVYFHGFGCKISKASTSVLVKKIMGGRIKDAERVINQYLSHFAEGEKKEGLGDEEMAAFLAARDFPGRLECATLAWAELEFYLKKKK